MWWRTHCDKTEPLSKRVPLRDRIVNGDFDFSSYYWQAQSAAIVGRNKLDLTKDDYRDQIDKTTIDIARYRRLVMDFEKEEGNRIQEFIESFAKAFNLTREEIYAELETWGGDMLGFYNYLSTGYPLSPYESRKIARKQSRKHPPLTEREYLTKRVIIRLLANPKTHYLMTPSGRYYLQTEDKKYTLILQNNFVKLTNHTYSFEFTIGSYVSDELIALVERAIEKTRSKMEDELSKNEINILKEMLK
jgi:hypothetical protein